MAAIRGVQVEVIRVATVLDDHGNETSGIESFELVDNVLPAPAATSDLSATRPNGDRIDMVFHFPKTYKQSLRGTFIEHGGLRFAVVGDPQPYLDNLTPLDWNREVEAVVLDG